MPKHNTPAENSAMTVSKAAAEPLKAKKPRKAKTEEQADEHVKSEAASVPDAVTTNKTHVAKGSKAETMRDKLHAEEKKTVMISLANGEKPGSYQSVILNGYRLDVRKGEYVDVPVSVFEVLDAKLKHQVAVQNHPDRVGGDKEVKMTTYGS